MKRKLIIVLIAAMGLSACAQTSMSSNDIAGLYTGYEQGTWYKFSKNCSAKLCDVY